MSTAPSSRAWLVDFVLLGAIWGASFMFMRAAIGEFGAVPTAAVRVSVGALVLLPLVFARGFGPDLRRFGLRAMAIGVVSAAIPFTLFAYSLHAISTGLSSILNATVPLFGAVVAWAWMGDRPNRSRVLGLVLGFSGVAALAWGPALAGGGASGVTPMSAVLACLLATLCYALGATAVSRFLRQVPSLIPAVGSLMGASLVLIPLAVWHWPQKSPSLLAWAAAVTLGVVCTGLAFILYFRMIDRIGPARALAVTFIVPVFALVYGTLLLGEPLTLTMVLCGAVILLGTALSTGILRLPAAARG